MVSHVAKKEKAQMHREYLSIDTFHTYFGSLTCVCHFILIRKENLDMDMLLVLDSDIDSQL